MQLVRVADGCVHQRPSTDKLMGFGAQCGNVAVGPGGPKCGALIQFCHVVDIAPGQEAAHLNAVEDEIWPRG